MTTHNKGAMTALINAPQFEFPGYEGVYVRALDYLALCADYGAIIAAQPAQTVAEAVDEDAAFKQWMIWHHDYDLCLTNECRKSARAGWDARARFGVFAPAVDAVPVHAATIKAGLLNGLLEWTPDGAKLEYGTKLYHLPTAAKGEGS